LLNQAGFGRERHVKLKDELKFFFEIVARRQE